MAETDAPAPVDGIPVAIAPRMTGPQKAATIMLFLGAELAAPVWEHLEEAEIRSLSLTMSELGLITKDAVTSVAEEFATKLSGRDAIVGTLDRTESFLRKILSPEKAEMIMDDIRGQASRNVWHKLSAIDATLLVGYLKGEHPQTIALIMSRLPPDIAARSLALLPQEATVDILNRMLRMNSVQRDALDNVEQALHLEFLSGLSRATRRDSHESIAEIFNAFDRQTESRLMGALEGLNETSATRIKELMFTFDDLAKLDSAAIQTMLRAVDRNVLTRALKGATEKARAAFSDNMSARAAKTLADDLAALGPLRLKDVDQAQATIIAIARDLSDKGEIVIGKSSADEFV